MLKEIQSVSGLFELRRYDVLLFTVRTCEGYQRWGYMDILEAAAHRILTTNSRKFKIHLRIIGTEE